MKVALVGNCQVVPLKELMTLATPELDVMEVEVWRLKGDQFTEAAAKVAECDIIVAQPIFSNYFGALEKESLKKIAREANIPIHFFHNLVFEAVLPDCIYLGSIGKRIKGPISDYHSSIVVTAYLSGANEAECLSRLHTGNGIDLESAWQKSEIELKKRESFVDVSFTGELMDCIRRFDSLHYFNHPRPVLIKMYGEKILRQVFAADVDCSGFDVPDVLAKYGTWPLYSWVAEFYGLPYARDNFLMDQGRGEMSLPEFVTKSYQIYASVPRDQMVGA